MSALFVVGNPDLELCATLMVALGIEKVNFLPPDAKIASDVPKGFSTKPCGKNKKLHYFLKK